jgi:CDP-glycerol glycerophosphotransferase (TagB/SpsB family)
MITKEDNSLVSFEQKEIKDNPNPQAILGFVIVYPFQFYVYKNIYRHLTKEAEFIVDLGCFFPVKQPTYLLDNLISLLVREKVYFRVLNYNDYFDLSFLERFFSKYQALVSVWRRGCLKIPCVWENRKQIHLPYGCGKELTTFGFWKANFDLILAYGVRDQSIFSQYTSSAVVGNPKFDDWFSKNLDQELIEKIKNQLDPLKKTLLYLPTHSDLSSIDLIAENLREMTSKFNVLIKFHYYNVYEEKERLHKFSQKEILKFDDSTDLLVLLGIADVVLSDNSSVIFDTILADKPIVVADFWSKDFLDTDFKKVKSYRRGWSGPLTYSGSIEQLIKKEGQVITINSPGELSLALNKALLDQDSFYRKERKKIRENLFSYNDGNCGKRAATEIKGIIQKKELPPKPLFYHLLYPDKIKEDVLTAEQQLKIVQEITPEVVKQKKLIVRFSNIISISGNFVAIEDENIFDINKLKTPWGNGPIWNKKILTVLFKRIVQEVKQEGIRIIKTNTSNPLILKTLIDLFGEEKTTIINREDNSTLTYQEVKLKDKFLCTVKNYLD